MSYTKRQFVNEAFEEIGIAAYTFDLEPEQLQSALRRLDRMVSSWNALGLRFSYPIPSSPEDSDLDDETDVPDAVNEAIVTGLAIRLCPVFGKAPSPATIKSARDSYRAMVVKLSETQELEVSNLPKGQGHKPYRSKSGEYIPRDADSLDAGKDAVIDLE